MPDCEKKYYGKVLLFGEYALIHGSPALARPTDLFHGKWIFDDSLVAKPAPILNALHAYCQTLRQAGVQYNADLFAADLSKGLGFQSTLPIGYGVGSSGAVTAALFDQYYDKPEDLELQQLQGVLGEIESFFHGKSSGFDPLICYLNKAVKKSGETMLTTDQANAPSGFHFFLINTAKSRKTEPLVKLYLDRYSEDPVFAKAITEVLNPLNQQAIEATLQGNGENLFSQIAAISRFQWKFFEPMVPASTKKAWAQSLSGAPHHIKLCGAGGGGFLLGISRNMEKTMDMLSPLECLIL